MKPWTEQDEKLYTELLLRRKENQNKLDKLKIIKDYVRMLEVDNITIKDIEKETITESVPIGMLDKKIITGMRFIIITEVVDFNL